MIVIIVFNCFQILLHRIEAKIKFKNTVRHIISTLYLTYSFICSQFKLVLLSRRQENFCQELRAAPQIDLPQTVVFHGFSPHFQIQCLCGLKIIHLHLHLHLHHSTLMKFSSALQSRSCLGRYKVSIP